ncbi:MAG: AAA family ATPase [Legionella sp.]|nr:AAA family ATPase [Legionella sp.]
MFPPEFYYVDNEDGIHYIREPQGELDVDKLIKSQPCWKVQSFLKNEKRKTLIVADWRAQNWTNRQVEDYILVFKQLLLNGFDVYAWQGDGFVHLHPQKIKSFMKKMTPELTDNILKNASIALALESDKLLVVDDHWLEWLKTREQPIPPRKLFASDFKPIDGTQVALQVVEIASQAKPILAELALNEVSPEAFAAFKNMQTLLPSLPCQQHWQRVVLSSAMATELLSTGVIKEDNFEFKQENLGNCSVFILNDDEYRVSNWHTLLRDNYKTLNLQQTTQPPENFLQTFEFPVLDVLYLHYTKLSREDIRHLLNSPRLQLFNYQSSRRREKLTEGLPLTNIKKFYAESTPFDEDDMHWFLSHQLKELSLPGSNCFNNPLPDFDFSALEYLVVRSSNITAGNFYQILKTALNLQELYSGKTTIVSEEFWEDLHLPQLKKWSTYSAKISPHHIRCVLQSTKVLSNLDIDYLEDLNESCIFETINFPELKELHAADAGLSVKDIDWIFQHMKKLTVLDLGNNKFLDHDFSFDVHCPNLRYLSLRGSNITAINLEKILTQAPNIEFLNLMECMNLEDDFSGEWVLKNLTDLNIGWSSLSTNNFIKFLRDGNQLITLNFGGYANCQPGFMQELAFPELENLQCGGANLVLEDVKKIMATSPKLQTFTIWGATNYCTDIFKGLNFQWMKDLDMSYPRFGNQDLINVLKSMPNLKKLNITHSKFLNFEDPVLKAYLKDIPEVLMEVDKDEVNSSELVEALSSKEHVLLASKKRYQHSPEKNFHTKPTPRDFKFQFSGKNKSKNQAMVIEKLSQYLTLKSEHTALIPKIQAGICRTLSQLFIDETDEFWTDFLDNINDWDGFRFTLSEKLKKQFQQLLEFIKADYELSPNINKTWLGVNVYEVLETLPMPAIFSNPWHAVGVKKTADGWHFYEPNSKKGSKLCDLEQLKDLLRRRLGTHIMIDGVHSVSIDDINADHFVSTGGILSLRQSTNKKELLSMLPEVSSISTWALNGLMLRTTKGEPAWLVGLETKDVSGFVAELLERYKETNPNFMNDLLYSVQAVSRNRFLEIYPLICNLLSNKIAKKTQKIFQKAVENDSDFDSLFKTWLKEQPYCDSPEKYCQEIIQNRHKTNLIEISHSRDISSLHYLFEQEASLLDTPVFYADTPSDLICSAPFIHREGEIGVLRQGPGGPLYDFLIKNRNSAKPPVLLINYTGFTAQDIVHFNNMLDDCRTVDGMKIPDNLKIIGFINPNNADNYQGEDFYSRFDNKSVCPFKEASLAKNIPSLSFHEKQNDAEVIDLMQALNWEEMLLGRWIIKKDRLIFKKGMLEKALAKKSTIHIQNGLWETPKFVQFWRLALLQGYVEHAGRRIVVPRDLRLSKAQGYDVDYLAANTFCYEGLADTPFVLNPSLLGRFFTRYHCDPEHKTLETEPGILALHKNQQLVLNVTRSISEQEWAILLQECRKYQINLQLYFAPGVKAPDLLKNIPLQSSVCNKKIPTERTYIISSTDPDATVEWFKAKDPEWIVVDVSECKPSDLLKTLGGHLNQDTLNFEFFEKESWLLNALESGKKVILKGRIHPELADHLAPLLLSRQMTSEGFGTLAIVTDMSKELHYAHYSKHEVSGDFKRDILTKYFALEETKTLPQNAFEKEPLCRLKTMLTHLRIHPSTDPKQSWEGMESLPGKIRLEPFDSVNSAAIARNFVARRRKKVQNILENSPYVCLTGLSAVGKTTFVQSILHNDSNHLYQGAAQIKDWALDNSNLPKYLFIDEANMGRRDWSEFEGLFQNPPGILVDGRFYPLTPEHKVIFAANPANYGNGRNLPALFKRHGNAVLFDVMPMEYIYETQLKEIFQGTALASQTEAICQEIMAVYRFVLECSEHELLISPRELQMMALLVLAHPGALENPLKWANYYATTLAAPLVPASYKNKFNELFPSQTESLVNDIPVKAENYLDTPQRQPVKTLLKDFLSLHRFRQIQAGNDLQRYGGLGGIILEGEPGIGKTELVRHCLEQEGLPYTTMPVSMGLSDKIKLLLKAFDEGSIVVIDEINSSPMLERLLNDLLMGKSPDGKRPTKPGFMIIGTQNPVTMAGRQKPAVALARRFFTLNVDNYTTPEMQTILQSKGLKADTSEKLVDAYNRQKNRAQRGGLKPIPTFRDLLREAKKITDTSQIIKKLGAIHKSGFWNKKRPADESFSEKGACKGFSYVS